MLFSSVKIFNRKSGYIQVIAIQIYHPRSGISFYLLTEGREMNYKK